MYGADEESVGAYTSMLDARAVPKTTDMVCIVPSAKQAPLTTETLETPSFCWNKYYLKIVLNSLMRLRLITQLFL